MKRKTYEKKMRNFLHQLNQMQPLKSDFLICVRFALTSGLFQKLANTQENPSCHINGNGMSS